MFFKSKIQKTESLIGQLSEAELRLAHEKIAKRLLYFRNKRQAQALAPLRIKDQVCFQYKNERVEGNIVKLNKVTAKIIDNRGHQWYISPSLLTKLSNDK